MRTRNTFKEQLVKQKAIELLVKDGFEGFGVNKLAKACGVSVATLYIYYKDKDDLIIKIAREEAKRMSEEFLEDFDTELSFEEGLRQQWKNRTRQLLNNPLRAVFFEKLRSSTYQDEIYDLFFCNFKALMHKFMSNAVNRHEINIMPVEVYWSVAFAPLYNLIRFHHEGKSVGGRDFVLNEEMIWQTFNLVIKALKK